MSEQDPRLIRIVARHFNDLQGLGTAVIGTLYAAGAGVWLATGSDAVTFLTVLVLVLPGACAVYALERFYAERFGRVIVPPSRIKFGRSLFVLFMLASFVLTKTQQVAFLSAVLGVSSVWLLIDCWPYRKHELFVIVAAGAAVQRVGWGPTASADDIAAATLLVGCAMTIAGLADHVLLVKGMRTQHPARTQHPHPSTQHQAPAFQGIMTGSCPRGRGRW
jgi:hypothetical protein